MRILILDNYDSFVYNLAQYVGLLGAEPMVYRSDSISLSVVTGLAPDRIIISPGPGTPWSRYFGLCGSVISELGRDTPILGVCLGHQGIIHTYGGRIVKARRIMHGKASMISHDGRGIFKGVPNPFEAARYHSLTADGRSIPPCLEISATSMDDGEVMAVRHLEHPVAGVQFHPESILTESGLRILKNFIDGEV
ncbi:aminodeoxychorismate/anthranilate synthase component II [Candidatus Bathyarchaeota archaeon]|nr:aminodeoxychorismate/anthranilate synthase component II [Candidatus Bathyarchaeota archaeon]